MTGSKEIGDVTKMELMTKQQMVQDAREGISRRSFLKGMVTLPLFALPLSVATNAATPVQAEAASKKTIRFDKVKIKAPSVWKKLDVYHGATYELQFGSVRPRGDSYYDYVPILFEGYFEGYTSATGKPKVKRNKASLSWKISKGGTNFYISAENIPYIVWQSAHKTGNWSLTKKQAKTLLKIATGDKIKYAKLVKWSKNKAKSKGKKAVVAWVGKEVLGTARFV